MSELTYEDFKRRVNIQELLVDAGYRLNRRDGLRYPSYVRTDSNGRRIRGDKFIVTANGLCCFQPPERRNYNVISFIKEHPNLFNEYTPGMSKDRLVNLVCRRLLNEPPEERETRVYNPMKDYKPFNLGEYDIHTFRTDDWDSQKKFYPYFKHRGIDLATQRAFAGQFFLSTRHRADGKRYANLSFPLTIPGKTVIVGLEERSRPNVDGKSAYKGKAAGSNSAQGLWIASPSNTPLDKATDIYWFESGYDVLAFYQLQRDHTRFDGAVFISTGGTPGTGQFAGVLKTVPEGTHHLCFDRDKAGQLYSVNFALQKNGRTFNSHVSKDGRLIVTDLSGKYGRYELDMRSFDFEQACEVLQLKRERIFYQPAMPGYKDWNDQLLDKRLEQEAMQEEPDHLEISGKATLSKALSFLPDIHPEHVRTGAYDETDLKAVRDRIEHADKVIARFEIADQGMSERGFQEMYNIRDEMIRQEKEIADAVAGHEQSDEYQPQYHR